MRLTNQMRLTQVLKVGNTMRTSRTLNCTLFPDKKSSPDVGLWENPGRWFGVPTQRVDTDFALYF